MAKQNRTRKAKHRKDLTAAYLRSILNYNPKTGIFTWKKRRSRNKSWNVNYAGKRAGTVRKDGYESINIGGRMYYTHRLAWVFCNNVWPKHEIDHKFGVKAGSRKNNIREATRRQNAQNMKIKRTNKYGLKGITLDKRYGTWIAHVIKNGKPTHVGSFKTAIQANKAYRQAAAKNYKEFANFG